MLRYVWNDKNYKRHFALPPDTLGKRGWSKFMHKLGLNHDRYYDTVRYAIIAQARRVVNYYSDLVFKELRRFVHSRNYIVNTLVRFFRSLGGDINYSYYASGLGYQKLVPENYEKVASAIAFAIQREIDNCNYGQAFCPNYPYYFKDVNGVEYLFPSKSIINCLYTQGQQESISYIFNKYFASNAPRPNFGAAYVAAIQDLTQQNSFSQDPRFYSIQFAAGGNYPLPEVYGFVTKILNFVKESEKFNMLNTENTTLQLLHNDKLQAGSYLPQQILYLTRPYMYAYFQPDVPLNMSFSSYMTLHKGKWPEQDVRQVLTHFLVMDSYGQERDEEGNWQTVKQLSTKEPLLGKLTDKEEQKLSQEYVFDDSAARKANADAFDEIGNNQFLVPKTDYFYVRPYQEHNIFSGQKEWQVPQTLYQQDDNRRIDDNNYIY